MKRSTVTVSLAVLAGLILGVLAKAGDVIPQGNVFCNFISGFGRVSSGFTLWIFACLFISNKAENRTLAVLSVTSSLASMLISYYAYSKIAVGYLSLRIVKFWLLMLIPSAIASYMVYGIKNKRLLKMLAAAVTACLGMVSIIFIEGLEAYLLIIECFLLVSTGILLFKKQK